MFTLLVIGIIFIVAVAASILISNYCDTHEHRSWLEGLLVMTFMVTVISFVCLVFAVISLAGVKNDFELCKAKYANAERIVEQTSQGNDTIPFYEVDDIVLETNNMISEHKVMCNDKWRDLWHSEEVGSLTPLTLDGK